MDHTVVWPLQCCKGDASSQWEKANLPLSPHPHPLTDNHEILHMWLRPRQLVKIAPGITSPHIAKVTTQFFYFFLLCTQNLSTDLELRSLNRFWHKIHHDAYSRRVVFFGVRTQYFQTFTLRTPKKPFLGTYNGKPMGNTYSHKFWGISSRYGSPHKLA